MKKMAPESVLDLYNLFLASVLIAAPWLFALNQSGRKNRLVGERSGDRAISLAGHRRFCELGGMGHLLLGLWLVVSPWIIGIPDTRAMHFSIGLGIRGRVSGPAGAVAGV